MVNLLLVYMVAAIIVTGVFGTDITADMVNFVIIYGIPFLTVTAIFIVFVSREALNHKENSNFNKKKAITVTIKLTIAFTPMLFLNNSGANILSLMRQS